VFWPPDAWRACEGDRSEMNGEQKDLKTPSGGAQRAKRADQFVFVGADPLGMEGVEQAGMGGGSGDAPASWLIQRRCEGWREGCRIAWRAHCPHRARGWDQQ